MARTVYTVQGSGIDVNSNVFTFNYVNTKVVNGLMMAYGRYYSVTGTNNKKFWFPRNDQWIAMSEVSPGLYQVVPLNLATGGTVTVYYKGGSGKFIAVNYYTITADANTVGGTVSGGGEYKSGETVTLVANPKTATPEENGTERSYKFSRWTDLVTNPTRSFPANADAAYYAEFSFSTYQVKLNVAPSNLGSVSVSGGDADRFFRTGTQLTFISQPAPNGKLKRWEVNGVQVSTESNYYHTVQSSDVTINAVFEEMPVTSLTLRTINGYMGEVYLKDNELEMEAVASNVEAYPEIDEEFIIIQGREYTFEAVVTDTQNNRFAGWLDGDDNVLSLNQTYKLTAINDTPLTVVGKFSEKERYNIYTHIDEVLPSGENWGELDGGGPIPLGSPIGSLIEIFPRGVGSPSTWMEGTQIRAIFTSEVLNDENDTPTMPEGWKVASWALYDYENHVAIKSEPNNKTPYFDFIIDRNVTVACVVEKEKYDVSAKPHPASIGKIQVDVSNQYYQTGETVPVQYEGSCTFKAREETIPEDYSFLGWFNENDEKVADSDSTTYQVQNVKAGFTLYAKVAVLVQIAASKSQDAASGKVHFSGESPAATADDYFALGDKVTINAVGGENANFTGWYLPDDTSFENPLDNYPASRELVVTAPVNLVAYFVSDAENVDHYIAVRFWDEKKQEYAYLANTTLKDRSNEESIPPITQLEWNKFYYDNPAYSDGTGMDDSTVFFKVPGLKYVTLELSGMSLGLLKLERVELVPVEGYDPNEPGRPPAYDRGASEEETDPSRIRKHSFATVKNYIVTIRFGDPEPVDIGVGFYMNVSSDLGSFTMHPPGEDHTLIPNGYKETFPFNTEVTLTAQVANGYRFVGWYATMNGQVPVSEANPYVFKADYTRNFYAKFEQDTEAIFLWEGSEDKKMLRWRSKRYVASTPINLSTARVYADGYPVRLSLFPTSSPDAPANEPAVVLDVNNEGMRRLPTTRREKYVEIEVESQNDVTSVGVSTSAQGLR